METMQLKRGCTYPDLDGLFGRADVTGAAEARLATLPGEVGALQAMLARPRPEVATGPHCTRPYECPFLDRCWAPPPPHHVSTLYRQQARALAALYGQGCQSIFYLP